MFLVVSIWFVLLQSTFCKVSSTGANRFGDGTDVIRTVRMAAKGKAKELTLKPEQLAGNFKSKQEADLAYQLCGQVQRGLLCAVAGSLRELEQGAVYAVTHQACLREPHYGHQAQRPGEDGPAPRPHTFVCLMRKVPLSLFLKKKKFEKDQQAKNDLDEG
jgi:hypothetical protein